MDEVALLYHQLCFPERSILKNELNYLTYKNVIT